MSPLELSQRKSGKHGVTEDAGKTYQLAGDTSQLAAEDGHWDRVSGSEESHAGTAAAAGAPTTLTVTKVRVVQTTCPTKK